MRIAVAGNPNTGKTTLFNALSGARAHVGNYPGVTVERREAPLRRRTGQGAPTTLIDLPGCYSLTARSQEEDVAQRVLLGDFDEPPCDAIVCVVDATQLRRGLYLALQLRELGLPLVLALTMVDVAHRRGLALDTRRLSELLGVTVVEIHAASQRGIEVLIAACERIAGQGASAQPKGRPPLAALELLEPQRAALDAVEAQLERVEHPKVPRPRALALWLLCSQLDTLHMTLPAPLRAALEAGQDAFAAMGEGQVRRQIIAARFAEVDELEQAVLVSAGRSDTASASIDRFLLHPVLGSVAFVVVMGVAFQTVFSWAKPVMEAVQDGVSSLGEGLLGVLPAGQLRSLLVDGIVAGIGNVMAFVPQIWLLFALLGLLEASGYMARAAVLADRIMRHVGLHGRAFVPLLSSFACAIPGIMAARTLETRRDRLVTMLMAPLMSCSARLPVYTLVAAATLGSRPRHAGIFAPGALAILAMYVLGFVAALGTGWLLRKTLLAGQAPPLVADLPPYRWPPVVGTLRRASDRAWAFVTGAGPTLLCLSVLLWAALSYPHLPGPQDAGSAQLVRANQLEHSYAGRIGHAIEPVIAPLGFDWRIGIGLLASVAAREVLVGTLAQVYALEASSDAQTAWPTLRDALSGATATGHNTAMTPLVGISLMVFFALAMQCMSTVAVLRRETGGWRWPIAALVYMNILAWCGSFCVYQGGRLLGLS